MKLNLGYSRVDHIEVPLFVPDLFTVEDGKTVYSQPIGDPQFIVIIRPLRDDAVREAFDHYLDGVARYFAEHAPKTPGREQGPETMVKTGKGRALHRALVLDVVMTAVIGWKNAPATDASGNPVTDAPYDADALRAVLAEETGLVDQIFAALSDVRSGKQVRLSGA